MEKYILFSNNNQNFALDITKIDRIIEFQQPKKLPESSEFLLGVIQFNDRILPIIDLTKRLYNLDSSYNENVKVIVVLWRDKQIGLVVDFILGIHSFDEAQFEQSNNDIQISKEYVIGFIKSKDDIIIVLEINKLFNLEQENELILSASNQSIEKSPNIGEKR